MRGHNGFFRLKLGKLSLNYPYYPFLSEALLRAASSREAIRNVNYCVPLQKLQTIRDVYPCAKKSQKLFPFPKHKRQLRTCTHLLYVKSA